MATVSKRLNNREVFPKTNWFANEEYDKVAEKAIDKHVRRLVLTMVCAHLSGRMSLDKAERCVIRAFERYEMWYYGLNEEELKQVIEKENANAQGRKGNK